jgi:hypothetical protein
LAGRQGKEFAKQAKNEPGYLAEQALIGFEIRTEHLGDGKHELAVREIKQQILGQVFRIQ